MRVPNEEHLSHPWRLTEVVPDFRLEDVWTLPTPGGPDDFDRLVDLVASNGPGVSSSPVVRALFAVRWWLGGVLGWDEPGTGLGRRVRSLRDRLPADLRDGPTGPAFAALPFEPLFRTADEFAAEIANSTMHGVLHLTWVPDPASPGGFTGRMAVWVRRNGLPGAAYMAAIRPFRHLLVYPLMLRDCRRLWAAGQPAGQPAAV